MVGVDPLSMLIGIMVLIHLCRSMPDALSDIAQAAGQAWNNAAHQARLNRLAQAGIAAPTRGGAARQYFAALWRDAQLNSQARRAEKRAAADAARGGPKPGGWRDKWRRAVDGAADRWQQRHAATPSTGSPAPSGGGGSLPAAPPVAALDPPPPDRTDGHTGGDQAQPALGAAPVVVDATAPTVAAPAGDGASPAPQALPAARSATAIEGSTTMSGTAVDVTTVSGAAAAARAIADGIEADCAAFVQQLQARAAQIDSLAASVHGNVEFRADGSVMGALARAREALAAGMGYVRRVAAEIVPAVRGAGHRIAAKI